MNDGRPDTFPDALREIAEMLDLADEAFDLIAKMRGVENPAKGTEMQRDLREMAAWIESTVLCQVRLNEVWRDM